MMQNYRRRPADGARYRNIKPKDIQALAKRYLKRENAICMLVKPRLGGKDKDKGDAINDKGH